MGGMESSTGFYNDRKIVHYEDGSVYYPSINEIPYYQREEWNKALERMHKEDENAISSPFFSKPKPESGLHGDGRKRNFPGNGTSLKSETSTSCGKVNINSWGRRGSEHERGKVENYDNDCSSENENSPKAREKDWKVNIKAEAKANTVKSKIETLEIPDTFQLLKKSANSSKKSKTKTKSDSDGCPSPHQSYKNQNQTKKDKDSCTKCVCVCGDAGFGIMSGSDEKDIDDKDKDKYHRKDKYKSKKPLFFIGDSDDDEDENTSDNQPLLQNQNFKSMTKTKTKSKAKTCSGSSRSKSKCNCHCYCPRKSSITNSCSYHGNDEENDNDNDDDDDDCDFCHSHSHNHNHNSEKGGDENSKRKGNNSSVSSFEQQEQDQEIEPSKTRARIRKKKNDESKNKNSFPIGKYLQRFLRPAQYSKIYSQSTLLFPKDNNDDDSESDAYTCNTMGRGAKEEIELKPMTLTSLSKCDKCKESEKAGNENANRSEGYT